MRSWISAAFLPPEPISLPSQNLSHSWIMIVVHLPYVCQVWVSVIQRSDDLTDFTLPHVYSTIDSVWGLPMNPVSSTRLNVMFRASLFELYNCHFSSSTSYLLSLVTSSRVLPHHSLHSELDLRLFRHDNSVTPNTFVSRIKEERKNSHDGESF